MTVDIAHLRQLLEASPTRPGTWWWDAIEASIRHRDENGDDRWTMIPQPLNDGTATVNIDVADAALIVAAVNALPELLDELERLRAWEAIAQERHAEVERLRAEAGTARSIILHVARLKATDHRNAQEAHAIAEVVNRLDEPLTHEAIDRWTSREPSYAALRAVYEAACEWSDWDGSDDETSVREKLDALAAVVDAARKADR